MKSKATTTSTPVSAKTMTTSTGQIQLLRALAVASCIVLVLYVSTVKLNGADFWLQAKIGQMILESQSIPETLLFPFTEVSQEKFNAHEWLSSILFALIIKIWGESGAAVVTGFLGGLLFVAIAFLAFIRSNKNIGLALVCGLIGIAAENYRHNLRPELIASVLMVFYWICLEKLQSEQRLIYALLALSIEIVWVNSHGSFILATVLSGAYFLGAAIDSFWKNSRNGRQFNDNAKLMLVFFLFSIIATIVNPSGLSLPLFALEFTKPQPLHDYINEWMPTFHSNFWFIPGLWIAGAVWLLTLVTVSFNFRRIRPRDAVIFIVFTIVALRAIRFLVYLGMVGAYIISFYAARQPSAMRWKSKTTYLAIMAFCAVCLALSFRYGNAFGATPLYDPSKTKLSQNLVDALNDPSREGNVLNSLELGPELIYLGYPRLRPSIDVRVDSYGHDYFIYHQALFPSEELFVDFVKKYNVRYLLLNAQDFGVLRESSSWNKYYWNPIAKDANNLFIEIRSRSSQL